MSSPIRLTTQGDPPSPTPLPRQPANERISLATDIDFSQFPTQAPAGNAPTTSTSYVWGTLIEVQPTVAKITRFLSDFTKENEDAPHYVALIQQVRKSI